VDARSERWREHRKKVRAEIVDAAFAAIDRDGPQVSLNEIAAQAGTAKPKIYRHFNDKADLFHAIGKRLRDMLVAAIFPTIDLATDPTREVVRRCVAEYVALVEQHPNVLRFVLQGRFPEPAESTTRVIVWRPRQRTQPVTSTANVSLVGAVKPPARLKTMAPKADT
jgi:AcrR family transcriptional regulator